MSALRGVSCIGYSEVESAHDMIPREELFRSSIE